MKLSAWSFRISISIMAVEVIVFILWMSGVLGAIGDPIATTLMRVAQFLAVIGAITSLLCLFTPRRNLYLLLSSLLVCSFSFCWLSVAFGIGSM